MNRSATLRTVLSLAFVAQAPPAELGPQPDAAGRPERPLVVIDADSDAELPIADRRRVLAALRGAGAITVALARRGPVATDLAGAVDLAIGPPGASGPHRGIQAADPDAAVADLAARVVEHPVAAVTLAWLLRGSAELPVPEALAAESAAYSTLLAGADFRGWLERRGPARPPDGARRVDVARTGDVLSVVLNRVPRRNAVDARMRDGLREALELALHDPALTVELSGAGPAFSAGGDLDEFGTASDLALAHVVRVAASPGAVVHLIRERVTARVHGACVGAGIEIPAFAGRVIAAPDAYFQLPELGMGLVPGAGGTVSITRRIGRSRLLWMALTGIRLDVPTALEWGLIDAVG